VTVVATAGHVDHGKSTLVQALTGTDPDRFAEEKARGLTIDLGFAACTLPSGRRLELVDVPGHVRFLSNMLAGVGAVGACLFVVAATEGWKPQSEEHLRILDLLGVSHGVVALTKVGLVDADDAAFVQLEIEERLAGSALEGAPVVAVDVIAGIGVDRLRTALDDLLRRTPDAEDRGRARLWVDRRFAMRGSGTVVTGTLAGGPLSVGDEVEIRPTLAAARVRALQVQGESLPAIGPGHRVAVNLSGVSHHDIERGHALVHSGRWVATTRVDATLRVLAALDHEVSRRGAFAVHIGTAEVPCRLRVLGPDALAPGAHGLVRLHLSTALALQPGDRFVLREHGRGETVGGGEILDVEPVLSASRARPDRSVARVIAERGWVASAVLERLAGEPVEPTVASWVASPAALAETIRSVAAAVERAGTPGLDPAVLDERGRAVAAAGMVVGIGLAEGRWHTGAVADVVADHPWLAAARAAPFSPPPPDGVDREILRVLARRELVVERDGVWFAAEAVDAAARTAAQLLHDKPDGITLSELREAWGTTRKWAVPLAGLLDAQGITRRRDDVRVAGPRLPAL
jgi:selenocysteine-specific elongation factor